MLCMNNLSQKKILAFISIFWLISMSDIFSINELTQILDIICQCDIKNQYQRTDSDTGNYLSVWHQTSVSTNWLWYWKLSVNVTSNISINELTLILEINCQCDIKHQYQQTDSDTGNYLSVWHQTSVSTNWLRYWKLSVSVTSNISITLPIKTITSDLKVSTLSYWARCDTSDNVCLHLQNGRYSICKEGQIANTYNKI